MRMLTYADAYADLRLSTSLEDMLSDLEAINVCMRP